MPAVGSLIIRLSSVRAGTVGSERALHSVSLPSFYNSVKNFHSLHFVLKKWTQPWKSQNIIFLFKQFFKIFNTNITDFYI